MSSVNEILAKLRLESQNVNNLSLSQLHNVLSMLSVKDISILCEVSGKFNTFCEEESFWKPKALNDYGIEKKYGNTWKQTVINMDKVNMINLSDKWIDGKTYKEILNNTIQSIADTVLDSQKRYLLPYGDNDEDATFLQEEVHDEKSIQDFAIMVFDRNYTDVELNTIFRIKSREINVIYAAVLTYKGGNGYLPGDSNVGLSSLSYEFLREMIDPILYVMQFSSFPDDRLRAVS